MIGRGWRWEVVGGNGGEEIERGRKKEGGGLIMGDGRGKQVGFGEEDGEEFD
jgi:hypothetical protein